MGCEDRGVWLIGGGTFRPHRSYFVGYTRHATASYVQGRSNDDCRYRSRCQTYETDSPNAAALRASLVHRCGGRLGRRTHRFGCVQRGFYRAGELILDIVARRQPWSRVLSNGLRDSVRRSSEIFA